MFVWNKNLKVVINMCRIQLMCGARNKSSVRQLKPNINKSNIHGICIKKFTDINIQLLNIFLKAKKPIKQFKQFKFNRKH